MLLIRGVVVAITVVVSKIDQIGLSSHVVEGGSVNFSSGAVLCFKSVTCN